MTRGVTVPEIIERYLDLSVLQTHERRATRSGRRSSLERQGAFGPPVFVLEQLSTRRVTVEVPVAPMARLQKVRVFVDFWDFQLSANDVAGRSFRPDWRVLSRWLGVEAAPQSGRPPQGALRIPLQAEH